MSQDRDKRIAAIAETTRLVREICALVEEECATKQADDIHVGAVRNALQSELKCEPTEEQIHQTIRTSVLNDLKKRFPRPEAKLTTEEGRAYIIRNAALRLIQHGEQELAKLRGQADQYLPLETRDIIWETMLRETDLARKEAEASAASPFVFDTDIDAQAPVTPNARNRRNEASPRGVKHAIAAGTVAGLAAGGTIGGLLWRSTQQPAETPPANPATRLVQKADLTPPPPKMVAGPAPVEALKKDAPLLPVPEAPLPAQTGEPAAMPPMPAPKAPVRPEAPVKEQALYNMTPEELNAFGQEYIVPQMKEAGGEFARFVSPEKGVNKIEFVYPQSEDILKARQKNGMEKIEGKDNGGLVLMLKRGAGNQVVSIQPVLLKTNAHFAYTTLNNNTYFSSDAEHLAFALPQGKNAPRIVNAVPSGHLHTLGFQMDPQRVPDAAQKAAFSKIKGVLTLDADNNPVADVQKSEIEIIGVPQAAEGAKAPMRWRHMDHNIDIGFSHQNIEMKKLLPAAETPAAQQQAHIAAMVKRPMTQILLGDKNENDLQVKTVFGLNNAPGRNPFVTSYKGDAALSVMATAVKRLSAAEAVRPGGDAFAPGQEILGQTYIGQYVTGTGAKHYATPVPVYVGAAVDTKVERASAAGVKDVSRALVFLQTQLAYPNVDIPAAEYSTGGQNFGSLQADSLSAGRGAIANPVPHANSAFMRASGAMVAKLNQGAILFGADGAMSGITESAHALARTNNGMPLVRMLGAGDPNGSELANNMLVYAAKTKELEEKGDIRPHSTVEPLRKGAALPKFQPLSMGDVREKNNPLRLFAASLNTPPNRATRRGENFTDAMSEETDASRGRF